MPTDSHSRRRRQAGKARIGISGWRYEGWRGVFYPPGLPQREELSYAADHFRSLELNGSFYSLQRPEHYTSWYESTPAGFVFAVKGSRFITHMKKLNEVEVPLANFFASGVLRLEDKLGPLLWQFPPNFRFDRDKLERFFRMLPRTTTEASLLARRRDSRVRGRASLVVHRSRRLRHAMEIRHPSFVTEEFVSLLRKHRIGLVVADTAGRWPFMEDITADFIYARLHGAEELYVSGYTDSALRRWAARVQHWQTGQAIASAKLTAPEAAPRPRDVYVYFDNDVKVHAPFDAMKLCALVEGKTARRREAAAR